MSKLFGLGGAERTDVRSDAELRGTDTVAGEFLSGIKSEDDTAIAALDFDRVAGADADLFPHGARQDKVKGAGPAHEPCGSQSRFVLSRIATCSPVDSRSAISVQAAMPRQEEDSTKLTI